MNTKLDADQSAAFMATKLRAQDPFAFFRFGDGFLELVAGNAGGTRDGEKYSEWLARDLRAAWDAVCGAPGVYLGDWLSATFIDSTEHTRYDEQYRGLIGDRHPNWLHFEALLLMRQTRELQDFYGTLRRDKRRKLFFGYWPAAAEFLRADFLQCSWTPGGMQPAELSGIEEQLLERDFEVLLYGAGMAGTIPVVRCWQQHPERTFINLGSALDPIAGRKTRHQQLAPQRARAMFREVMA